MKTNIDEKEFTELKQQCTDDIDHWSPIKRRAYAMVLLEHLAMIDMIEIFLGCSEHGQVQASIESVCTQAIFLQINARIIHPKKVADLITEEL